MIKLDCNGNIQSVNSNSDDIYLCESTSNYSIYLDKYGCIYIQVNGNENNLCYYNKYNLQGMGNDSNHGKISSIGGTTITYYNKYNLQGMGNDGNHGKIRSIGDTYINW